MVTRKPSQGFHTNRCRMQSTPSREQGKRVQMHSMPPIGEWERIIAPLIRSLNSTGSKAQTSLFIMMEKQNRRPPTSSVW